MRRQRRQDVLHGAVLVDVAGDAERRQLAHFVGARDRAAENQDRQPAVIDLADLAHDVRRRYACGRRRSSDQQVELGRLGAHARQQFCRALDRERAMARALDRRLEAVANERRVVGDENGFRG